MESLSYRPIVCGFFGEFEMAKRLYLYEMCHLQHVVEPSILAITINVAMWKKLLLEPCFTEFVSAKNKAIVAVELSEKQQVKQVYIKAIDDYSAQSLTPNI